MRPIRVYSWYDYLGAPFPRGVGYSRGLDVLGDKLCALPGVTVAPDFTGKIETIELNVLHQHIAADRSAHEICIDAVHALSVPTRERIPA